jgi:3-isopropylmalate/(R)-2-methylmalate dehydratase large subunit
MGMTLTEKILASHAGKARVEPGELILARVDLALGNDVTAPIAIEAVRRLGATEVFDREKIALVPDHFAPNKDIRSAEQAKMMREFARDYGIVNYFEVGRMGIEHVLLPDEGLVVPGDLVIGADSHTCTYGALCAFSTGVGSTDLAAAMISGEVWLKVPSSLRIVLSGKPGKWVEGKDVILSIIGKIGVDGALYQAMEIAGEGISSLPMAWRFTMSNMAIEAGAKNGIFPFDETTRAYADARAKRKFEIVTADADARYAGELPVDLAALEPQVAFPHLPENTRPLSQVGNVPIDQVVVGSCTNGRIRPRSAATVGRKVHDGCGCWCSRPRRSTCRRCARAVGGVRDGGRAFHPDVRPRLGTWGFSPRANVRSPPPTGTSWAGWGTPRARYISRTPRSPPPPRCWAGSAAPTGLYEESRRSEAPAPN